MIAHQPAGHRPQSGECRRHEAIKGLAITMLCLPDQESIHATLARAQERRS